MFGLRFMTFRFDGVSVSLLFCILWYVTKLLLFFLEKYVQAARALYTCHDIDSQDPELHVRIVDFKQRGLLNLTSLVWPNLLTLYATVSSLASPLPPTINSVVTSAISALIPEELQPETFDSQYRQRHSTSALSVLASAKVSSLLKAPLNEVEETVFSILSQGVDVDVKVR